MKLTYTIHWSELDKLGSDEKLVPILNHRGMPVQLTVNNSGYQGIKPLFGTFRWDDSGSYRTFIWEGYDDVAYKQWENGEMGLKSPPMTFLPATVQALTTTSQILGYSNLNVDKWHTCPTCGSQCNFPHNSDQEDVWRELAPENCSIHNCINGHTWVYDIIANSKTGILPHQVDSYFELKIKKDLSRIGRDVIKQGWDALQKEREEKKKSHVPDDDPGRAIEL